MRLRQPRPGVFVTTLTAHELSALLASARISLSLMEADPIQGGSEARVAVERVLRSFDRALHRLHHGETGP